MYWTTYKDSDSSICYNGFVAVAVDDYIYLFIDDYYSLEPIEIHVLNTNTLEWSLLPNPIDINGKPLKPPHVPVKRMGHSVVAYDKKIYLWGGESDEEEITNTLYCFDTEALNWSRPKVTGIIPKIRTVHSACISNHLMYICGGFDWDIEENLNDVWCLDLKTMNWSNIITTGEIPSPRQLHAAIINNNRMYIHGGCDSDEKIYFTDIMYLDLESNQWHRLETTSNIPVGYNDDSLFVHNNIIYIFGSCTGCNYEKLNDLYCLDTKRNHWNLIKPRGKSPKLRNEQSCILIGDKMFLLCVTSPGSEIYVLDFNPSLKTLATMAIIENGLDFSCLPTKLRSEIDSMRQHSDEESNSNDIFNVN